MNNEKILNISESKTEIKNTTITNEIKILSYYELIDKLKEMISKNPDDHFMNDRRFETIKRFEKKISQILHKKSFKRKIIDLIKRIF